METIVQVFLDRHWDRYRPLLVAYSGGPDSKALLYAALQTKVPLHVAHVDHGWREESAQEAASLQREVEGLGLAFHSIRLSSKMTEDEARKSRLAYFCQLIEQFGFQAVLLGHQANDLAETVLKRVFEGAHLTSLKAIQPCALVFGIPLWRPLLTVCRSEIEKWLESRSLRALKDPANADPKYQRARMRTTLLPFLNEQFGKEIFSNLCQLSARSQELE